MTHVPMGEGGAIKYPEKLITDPHYKKIDLLFAANIGLTAEKLHELSGIKREPMDQFSYRLQTLAAKGQKAGWFKSEIMPVKITLPDASKQMFDYDASVRSDTKLDMKRAVYKLHFFIV